MLVYQRVNGCYHPLIMLIKSPHWIIQLAAGGPPCSTKQELEDFRLGKGRLKGGISKIRGTYSCIRMSYIYTVYMHMYDIVMIINIIYNLYI